MYDSSLYYTRTLNIHEITWCIRCEMVMSVVSRFTTARALPFTGAATSEVSDKIVRKQTALKEGMEASRWYVIMMISVPYIEILLLLKRILSWFQVREPTASGPALVWGLSKTSNLFCLCTSLLVVCTFQKATSPAAAEANRKPPLSFILPCSAIGPPSCKRQKLSWWSSRARYSRN